MNKLGFGLCVCMLFGLATTNVYGQVGFTLCEEDGSEQCASAEAQAPLIDRAGLVLSRMYGRDQLHTGRSPYLGPQTATLEWFYQTDGRIESTPAVGADGTIYFGSVDNIFDSYFYALNPDGTLKWRYPSSTVGGIWTSPALARDGTIYWVEYSYCDTCPIPHLNAMNPDGTLKWRYPLGRPNSHSPVVVWDGTIYVSPVPENGGTDWLTLAINPDGTLKWSYPVPGHTPAVGLDGTVYFPGYDQYFYALNADGTLKWRYFVGATAGASPSVALDGTIYVPYQYPEENLIAFSPDGTLKWRVKTLGDAFSMAALGWDGTIYVTHGTHRVIGYLTAVSRDGVMKQQIRLSNPTSAIAVGRDGTLYFGGLDGYVYALGTRGGLHLKWRYRTGDTTESSPALAADGRLYIGLRDGELYAIKE